MRVVYFPVCRRIDRAPIGPNQVAEGLWWYGGRGFKSREAWLEKSLTKRTKGNRMNHGKQRSRFAVRLPDPLRDILSKRQSGVSRAARRLFESHCSKSSSVRASARCL